MAFTIKQNDTRPAWVVPLKENFGEDDEAAINLSTALSVKFLMREQGETGAPKVSSPAAVTDATNGEVTYTWDDGDTDTAGTYDAEVEITWGDDGVETVPNDDYFTVIVKDDLG